jgi:D-alanine-D-alanine ligase
MDKVVTKQLCEHAKIPVTPYIWFLSDEFRSAPRKTLSTVEERVKFPCFVKPANLGSSVGISKVHNRAELSPALELAAAYDRRILVEKGIEDAREIELGVLGNENPVASVEGEVVSSNEFYDYDAKYVDGRSNATIPASLPKSVAKKLREYAVRGFRAVDCAGMARVDFLVVKRTHRIYFNEINTIPGFTSISMYPKLWEASGVPYPQLLDKLIGFAIARNAAKQALKTTFKPKSDWYKEG